MTPERFGESDFRFAGVDVQVARFRLLVDGEERPIAPLALRLLIALCEADGRVLTRRELFDRLWPRQDVGDESLTQQTARLRECLRPYADHVVTVRRVGLRLAGPIERRTVIDPGPLLQHAPPQTLPDAPSPAPVPADELTAASVPVSPVATKPRELPLLALLATVMLLVLAIGVWHWQRSVTDESPLPGAQGLTVADLGDESASSRDAVRRALALDADGRRQEAQVLLKITHDRDRAAAWPASFLALWSQARGARDEALQWRQLALERLHERPGERLRLLLHTIDHAQAGPDLETMATLQLMDAGAAPSLSRAHAYLGRAERELARAELEQLDVVSIDPVLIPVVIGDLASLGAGEKARLWLQQLEQPLGASLDAEIKARFAASEGDWPRASQLSAEALVARPPERAFARQSLLALHYALEAGRIEYARELLERSLRDPRVVESPRLAFDLAMLRVGFPEMDAAAVQTILEPAWLRAQAMDFAPDCWEVQLLASLHRLPDSFVIDCAQAPTSPMPVAGMDELLGAASAYRDGQFERARAALERASQVGIDDSLFAAHARALRRALAMSLPPEPSYDPPYPVWSRHSVRRMGPAPLAAP